MNAKRKAVVTQAFNKLDIDKSGFIDMNEIKHSYSAKNHPDVRQGKRTEEDVNKRNFKWGLGIGPNPHLINFDE